MPLTTAPLSYARAHRRLGLSEPVTALSQILAYDKATIPLETMKGFINQLMAVDRTLAQTAVNEAPDGAAKRKAQDQIDQGTEKEKRGMYESALNQYKSAWSLVQPQ